MQPKEIAHNNVKNSNQIKLIRIPYTNEFFKEFTVRLTSNSIVSEVKRDHYQQYDQGKVKMSGSKFTKEEKEDKEYQLNVANYIKNSGSGTDGINRIEEIIKLSKNEKKYKFIRFDKMILNTIIKHYGIKIESNKNKSEISDLNEFVALHVGKTSSGKTEYIINSVYDKEKSKIFSSLISTKESTNFNINHVVNRLDTLNEDEVELHIYIKNKEQLEFDIGDLVYKAILKLIKQINNILENNNLNDNMELEQLIENFKKQVTNNKKNTFNLKYILDDTDVNILIDIVAKILSINVFGKKNINCGLKEILIKLIENGYKDIYEKIKGNLYESICLFEEYNCLKQNIINKLFSFKEYFEGECKKTKDLELSTTDNNKILKIKFRYDLISDSGFKNSSEIIKYIFGSKVDRFMKNKDYKSLENIIYKVNIYSTDKNKDYIVCHSDGVGFNQGSKEDDYIIKNNIRNRISEVKPNIILYHTAFDAKDELFELVINELTSKGFKHQLFIDVSKFDKSLPDIMDEFQIENEELENNIEIIKEYVFSQYISNELKKDSLFIKEHLQIIDKKGYLKKYYNEYQKNPFEGFCMDIDEFNKYIITECRKLNEKDEKFLSNMQNKQKIFNELKELFIKTKSGDIIVNCFISKLDKMIPLEYSKLRWNTLNKALKDMCFDNNGYGIVDPIGELDDILQNLLSYDEFKNIFIKYEEESGISDLFKNKFIEKFRNIMKISFMYGYHFEYKMLLKAREDSSLRLMKQYNLTQERKIILRDIFKQNLYDKGYEMTELLIEITRELLNIDQNK